MLPPAVPGAMFTENLICCVMLLRVKMLMLCDDENIIPRSEWLPSAALTDRRDTPIEFEHAITMYPTCLCPVIQHL